MDMGVDMDMDMDIDMDMDMYIYGHGHGHFSFISGCFEWSFGVRLYRNIETSCFYIKAKQPKLTSCFG